MYIGVQTYQHRNRLPTFHLCVRIWQSKQSAQAVHKRSCMALVVPQRPARLGEKPKDFHDLVNWAEERHHARQRNSVSDQLDRGSSSSAKTTEDKGQSFLHYCRDPSNISVDEIGSRSADSRLRGC